MKNWWYSQYNSSLKQSKLHCVNIFIKQLEVPKANCDFNAKYPVKALITGQEVYLLSDKFTEIIHNTVTLIF